MELSDLQTAVERFAEKQLRPYLDFLKRPKQRRTGKEISDPVWKTIHLTAFEVVLLDSPILQRLRLIRQLGVAHWVYPGAVHTRFEHALGTLYQVQELIDAINRSAAEDEAPVISAKN